MITQENIDRLLNNGGNVNDSDGTKVGSIGQVYVDDQTGKPSWVTVKTGMFGKSETFAPLEGASADGDDVQVAYSKDQIKDAPHMDPDGDLSVEEEGKLYQHYGLSSPKDSGKKPGGERTDHSGEAGVEGRDTSGPTTDDAMTRSEERLNVGTESQETGRVRLRKHVVTENVTQTVPVSHEEVTIDREPITDANRGAATSGPELSDEEHEVTLHAERPVVEKETVPVERVQMGTKTVTDQETVNEEVRKEEIETDSGDRRR